MNELNNSYRHISGKGGCDKITMLALSDVDVHVRREQARYVLYSIKYNEIDFNIVGVHLQDRRNSDSAQRISIVGRLMNDLKKTQADAEDRSSLAI